MSQATTTANETAQTTGKESNSRSDDYDELLESLQQALEWARGERELRSVVRSTEDEWYADPDKKPDDAAPALPLTRHPAAKR